MPLFSPSAGFILLSLPFGVDPVLVGMITVLLLIVFALFLFIRKTLLNLSEGIREGKRR
jgi:ABC-type sulfate transport system permease subunit